MALKTRRPVSLGLRTNASQFALLVLVNAFVGTMVGVERSVLPLLAQQEFGLAVGAASLAYIGAFGISKAALNLIAGPLAERWGRKRILVAGWMIGLPVPLLLMWAPTWGWVVFANLLLGASQGLAWSMTVNMKVDLVGPARRGLALGFNECSGYLAMGLAAYCAAQIGASLGLRPWPFVLALAAALLGLVLSVLLVRDTAAHVALEGRGHETGLPFARVFALATWKNRSLFGASQAGLVNNLNDAVAWGLLPLIWAAQGLSLPQIGLLAATYLVIWAFGQLVTGALSDLVGRKPLIVTGMALQAVALWATVLGTEFEPKFAAVSLLGIGTALVYPTLLGAVSDVAAPTWRASALGVYRFWRDIGFLVGALAAGTLAQGTSPGLAVSIVAIASFASGLIALVALQETLAAPRLATRE